MTNLLTLAKYKGWWSPTTFSNSIVYMVNKAIDSNSSIPPLPTLFDKETSGDPILDDIRTLMLAEVNYNAKPLKKENGLIKTVEKENIEQLREHVIKVVLAAQRIFKETVTPSRKLTTLFIPFQQQLNQINIHCLETARRIAILILTCAAEVFWIDDVPAINKESLHVTPKTVMRGLLTLIEHQKWWSGLFTERTARIVKKTINPECLKPSLPSLFDQNISGDPILDKTRILMLAEVISYANPIDKETIQEDTNSQIEGNIEGIVKNKTKIVLVAQHLFRELENVISTVNET